SLLFCAIIRRPPTSKLFPYTTLFRSLVVKDIKVIIGHPPAGNRQRGRDTQSVIVLGTQVFPCNKRGIGGIDLAGNFGHHIVRMRSEEHTSELQSRENLVCRLLLEKKK